MLETTYRPRCTDGAAVPTASRGPARAGVTPAAHRIECPAGWGETSLLAEWPAAASKPAPVAWLALTPPTHNLLRFWTYAEALRTENHRHRSHTARPRPHLAALRSSLIFVFVFVCYDYHLNTNAEVREAMAFWSSTCVRGLYRTPDVDDRQAAVARALGLL